MKRPIYRTVLATDALVSLTLAVAAQASPRRSTTFQGKDAMEGELLVQFREGVSAAQRHALHAEWNAWEVREFPRGAVHIAFDGGSIGSMLEAYRSDSRVELAEPNWLHSLDFVPDDSQHSQQWAPQKVNAPLAWDLEQGNDSIVIAIVDSGANTSHLDLSDNFAFGWDVYDGDSDPSDQEGHGTHVSGIAAAVTNNSYGVAGIGFDCQFAAYRCGNSSLPTSDTTEAIYRAVSAGAHVINMSFSGAEPNFLHEGALEVAHEAGCVLVASAGNLNSSLMRYPAGYPNVIAVANSNQNDEKNVASNFGDWIEVAAPGVAILSTTIWNFGTMTGTSMSTPLVSGVAGLLYAKLNGVRSAANADRIREAILNSSVPLPFVGFGRVDAHAALIELPPPAGPLITAIVPSEVEAFFSTELTIIGTGLLGATQVAVGSVLYDSSQFTVTSDTTLTLDPHDALALGTVPVVVTTPAGSSSSSLEFVETSPPQVTAPFVGIPGHSYTIEWAGGANDVYLLTYATDPQTFPFMGFELLLGFTVAEVGVLSDVGYGSLTVPALGVGPLSLSLQVINVDGSAGNLTGASDVKTVFIL